MQGQCPMRLHEPPPKHDLKARKRDKKPALRYCDCVINDYDAPVLICGSYERIALDRIMKYAMFQRGTARRESIKILFLGPYRDGII